jgi:predicted NBD/HSP70 family sugar kinase
MYLGVDIGGTKTLVGLMDDQGVILDQKKFPTPRVYEEVIVEIKNTVNNFTTENLVAAGIGMPATNLDRDSGIGLDFGNLPWRNVPIQSDLSRELGCKVVVENDAKLAGLSESMLLGNEFKKVLYIAIGTGIGFALIVNRTIDTAIGDGGGQMIILEHDGKYQPWENFASGKAIKDQFGKPASEITEKQDWAIIARNLALGFVEIMAMTEPDIIVIGGGVAPYLPNFIEPLNKELKRYENPLLKIPPIREAQRPETAVVYGGYDLAKALYG